MLAGSQGVELSEIRGVNQKRSSSGNKPNSVASASCRICGAQYKMKMWGPCSKARAKYC